jgi:hypothetical protein
MPTVAKAEGSTVDRKREWMPNANNLVVVVHRVSFRASPEKAWLARRCDSPTGRSSSCPGRGGGRGGASRGPSGGRADVQRLGAGRQPRDSAAPTSSGRATALRTLRPSTDRPDGEGSACREPGQRDTDLFHNYRVAQLHAWVTDGVGSIGRGFSPCGRLVCISKWRCGAVSAALPVWPT